MSRLEEIEKIKKKLNEIIKLGTCVTLLETSVNKSLLIIDAFKKRKIIKIYDEYKIEFDCVMYDIMGYWRHPSFYLFNPTLHLEKKSNSIYILTVGLKNSSYSVYQLESK